MTRLTGIVRIGLVEEIQEGIRQSPHPVGVDRPPVPLRGGAGGLPCRRDGELDHTWRKGHFPVDLRPDGKPPQGPVQFTGGHQKSIAQLLGRESARREVGEQLVIGVLSSKSLHLPVVTRLPVGPRSHDEPVHALEGPPLLHKIGCQPIQQVRMGGPRALGSEIVGVPREALAKVMLPDPIHDDPRGERITGIGYPLREGQSTPLELLSDAVGLAVGAALHRHAASTQHARIHALSGGLQRPP